MECFHSNLKRLSKGDKIELVTNLVCLLGLEVIGIMIGFIAIKCIKHSITITCSNMVLVSCKMRQDCIQILKCFPLTVDYYSLQLKCLFNIVIRV